MTRARSPDREKARLMWLRSGKTLKLKEIAEKLSKPVDTISRWKREDHWGDKKSTKNQTKKKDQRGAPLGNQNAAGMVLLLVILIGLSMAVILKCIGILLAKRN